MTSSELDNLVKIEQASVLALLLAWSTVAAAVELRHNRAPDPGPAGWRLVWSDEFNEPKGQPPNPAHWTHEIGDGTANGIPGWGNNEIESYTDRLDNAATDGAGHLAITAARADGSLSCHYGPCQYTSARLISRHKGEFTYGRIEARIRVPQGAGVWPAFWSLGTNIGEVGWPRAGEIDIIRYHSATPASVAPNQWVFNHPFFLILNLAVGGYLAGPVAPDTVFPQSMLVDYVRVYQGPDTADRIDSR